jgi:hypothetical protein
VDDTIISMEHNLEKTLNMKLILCIFDELSRLKIKFHKSEVFCFSVAKEVRENYINLIGSEAGSFPFIYLGIPIQYRQLKKLNRKSLGIDL